MKIVQAFQAKFRHVEEAEIFGLSNEGNLYYWGYKNDCQDTGILYPDRKFGWILLVDEINK